MSILYSIQMTQTEQIYTDLLFIKFKRKICVRLFHLCYLCAISLLLLLPLSVKASGSETGIRIIPQTMEVRDDSVRIDLKILAEGIQIPAEQALNLIPELHYKGKRVVLPPIVLSGKRRAQFDRREETVRPELKRATPYHVWVGVRRGDKYTLHYKVSIPYAAWMEHAELRLKQVSHDCCEEFLLADDVLTNDINLVSPCANRMPEAPVLQAAERKPEVKEQQKPVQQPVQLKEIEHRVQLTLYIDYPQAGSSVDPSYGRNRYELQKVDSLLATLLGDPAVTIREIRVTGYASPEGAYRDNEALAKARSLGFKGYLTKAYGLQDYPFRTAWVAEDWEGLRKLLKGLPYEAEALDIINRYTVFEERECYLMQLQDGWPYRNMLRVLFPQLRRIEIIITYKTIEAV